MRYRLYFRGHFQSEHADFADAEAQARWNHFEFRSQPWEGLEMPPGFMISSGSSETHPETPSL